MNALTRIWQDQPEFKTILSDIHHRILPIGILGLAPVLKAHLISSISSSLARKALVVLPDEAAAHRMASDLTVFGLRAMVYPARDFTFRTTESKSRDFEQKRLAVLGAVLDGSCDICLCSAEAAAQLTIPPTELQKRSATLRTGEEITLSAVVEALICADYVKTEMVDGMGQFAVRGGILDFFPPDSAMPVRVEFWGDTIDSLSHFDILTQRRGEPVEQVKISPASEVIFPSEEVLREKLEAFTAGVKGKGSVKARESLRKDMERLDTGLRLTSVDKYLSLAYDSPASIFDYFSDALVFFCESAGIREKHTAAQSLLHEDMKILFEEGVLCKGLDRFALTFPEMLRCFAECGGIYMDHFARGSFDVPVRDLISVTASQLSAWEGSLSVLIDDLKPAALRGMTQVILAGSEKTAAALCEDLIAEGISAIYYPRTPEGFLIGSVNILSGSLSGGMEFPQARLRVITYGRGRSAAQAGKRKGQKGYQAGESFHSVDEIHRGDYVVHATHGIGIFDGVTKLEADGVIKDFLRIRYAASDVLYVPVTQLDLVSKYIAPHGDDGKAVKLNRLGSKEWEKTKSRVRGAVREMAGQLIALYSKRLQSKGFAFSPDIDMQSDFERRFEFDETDDQLRCIAEIKRDMEQPHPMDRLLCGDVGFGKTEVALRAAFKCVADGKQCAILVPTTILAFQHYQTVLKRVDGFPVTVEMLSRYRTPKQQAKILTNLRRGTIDIIIGTHRMISQDVKFKDVGLVIVDEEQRFGVAQKERLKEMFPDVDVLTMSATPIPRTLNMAMTGIRDMSVIEEAPSDRLPVQSYVVEYDEGIIAEAIEKELRRGGQVYYLHNQIEDIEEKAARLHVLVPQARIGIAHGKMNEEEISSVWQQLLEGELDILVCTTIIETGVDVPNCNTLIVENADRMGLAQLHQIRGRVGRSSRRASAYFMFKKGKQLTEIAQRRLDAIREFTEFGSGFKIAMRDLEIRGAGNILGAQQHGHMEAVGYDMYIRLLTEAVSELEGEKDGAQKHRETADSLADKECLIDVRLNAHIPEAYIESLPQRLGIYRRIADIKNESDADDVIDELIDRFGEPPESVRGLITVALLRNTAASFGVYEIKQKGENILLFVRHVNMTHISRLAGAMRGRIMVSASDKPYITVKKAPKQSPLGCLNEVFTILRLPEKKTEK